MSHGFHFQQVDFGVMVCRQVDVSVALWDDVGEVATGDRLLAIQSLQVLAVQVKVSHGLGFSTG